MGRFFVELDPDGYPYCAEPGAMFSLNAVAHVAQVRAGFRTANPNETFDYPHPFALPAVSGADGKDRIGKSHPWLLCKPRQTWPDWTRDSRMVYHVLRSGSEWAWSVSVSDTIREWEPTRQADGTSYPLNKWQTIPRVPSGGVSLLPVDWSAVATASGLDIPSSMVVVGVAGSPPSGGGFQHLTPLISLHQQPGPDDYAVFGFGEYLVIMTESGVVLLKEKPAQDGWNSLGTWAYSTPKAGVLIAPMFNQHLRTVLFLNVPPGHLGMMLGGGNAITLETTHTEPGTIAAVNVREGSWWVAGSPGSRLTFQMQVVGYENVNTGVFRVPTTYNDFDLGPNYLPTADAEISAYATLHYAAGVEVPDPTITADSWSAVSPLTAEEVTLSLLTGASPGVAWASNGVNRAGFWQIELVASTDRLGGYQAPALRDFSLKFPVLLTPRENTPLILDDTKFRSFTCESSLYEPDGKRLLVDLWDTGLETVSNAGFDSREGYPIRVLEDTDADNVGDEVRAVGWVQHPDIAEHFTETASRAPVRFYRLQAKGILSRAAAQWHVLPQMVDPDGAGFIEHTYAVGQAMLGAGINTSSAAQYIETIDTQAGTVRARLLGTWSNATKDTAEDAEDSYAPEYDESKLEYASRIAQHFAGWVLYETLDGVVRYHPELRFELSLGAAVTYYVSASVYRTEADAVAASSPRQKYLALPSQAIEPVESNSIRMFPPKDVEDKFDPVLIQDTRGWTDPTYENFVGEPRPLNLSLKNAVNAQAARILASVYLLTAKQRAVYWLLEVPLAPWNWDVTAGMGLAILDVGYVITVQGKGDRLITQMSVELLKSGATSELRTRLTTARLPTGSTAVTGGTVQYPGRMVT